MDSFGILTAPRTVRFERLLPGPIEKVWSYLVESDKRAKWLASGPLEPKVGGALHWKWNHADLSPIKRETPERFKEFDCGHEMSGKVLRCEPPHLLQITWSKREDYSDVTFELTERGDKVLLTLTHANLPDRAQTLGVSGGWHTHLDVLVEHLEGRTPPFFWDMFARMGDTYEKRIPQD